MVRAVVFDLDHTLFDRYATISYLLHTAIQSELPFREDVTANEATEAIRRLEYQLIHTTGLAGIAKALKAEGYLKDDVSAEDGTAFIYRYIYPQYCRGAVLFPFTRPVLTELKEMGLHLGLITNGDPKVQYRKVDLLGIGSYFDHIIVGGEFGRPKPDPAIFQEMMWRLEIDTTNALYVGDHPVNDVCASRNAGLTPVWVRTIPKWTLSDAERAAYEIDTVAELPDLIRKINHL